MKVKLAGAIGSLVVGALLAGAGSAQPPPALRRDQAALDAKLAAVIKREAAGRLDYEELRDQLKAVHADTVDLTKHFHSAQVGKLGGLDPGVVIKQLECVDSDLAWAFGQAEEETGHALKSTTALFAGFAKVVLAWDCAETLRKELVAAHQPSGLTDAATNLELAPAHVIEKWAEKVIEARSESQALDNMHTYFEKQLLHDVRVAFAQAGAIKKTMARTYFTGTLYGVPAADVISDIECVGENLAFAEGVNLQAAQHTFSSDLRTELFKILQRAQRCKQALEAKFRNAAAPPPAKVSISEDDTWAHNAAIGKSRICVNVRTTPAQSFVSATITGPGGFSATVTKSPLHADGTAQIRGIITQPGDYTKTLVVYDAKGVQTATVTKTFTVAPPPQDGPTTTPPCEKPAE